tara:strand:+ start:1531 stop:2238 length:708 start_codon:yes stop_codon:yes gene_type:complete
MAYTPPNVFVPGTVLTAAAFEGNMQALRVYLHSGIAVGDVENVQWIDTRHIQPPLNDAFTGMQHGVSGHQGGQWSGGAAINLTFTTKYLCGQGAQGPKAFHRVPNTSFVISLRRDAKILYHYQYDVEVGPDESPYGSQVPAADRQIWIGPYDDGDPTNFTPTRDVQETPQNISNWMTNPVGAVRPYTIGRGYGQRDGTVYYEKNHGEFRIGLSCYSRVDRSAVINWSVALEIWYM